MDFFKLDIDKALDTLEKTVAGTVGSAVSALEEFPSAATPANGVQGKTMHLCMHFPAAEPVNAGIHIERRL